MKHEVFFFWVSKVLKTIKNILCFPFVKVKNHCIFAAAYAEHFREMPRLATLHAWEQQKDIRIRITRR